MFSIDAASGTGVCTLSQSGTSVSFTGVGTCVIDANQAGNSNYTDAPEALQAFSIGPASSTTKYTGPQQVSTGASITPSATLASGAGACEASQVITFTLSGNPITGAAATYTLESATTNPSGQTTGAAISRAGWQTGSYTISATYAGAPTCTGSSASDALLVTTPGLLATGAGVYSLPSPVGQVAIAFFTAQVPHKPGTYTGGLALVNRHRWRFSASITSYVTTSPPEGIVQGTGVLYWWNTSLDRGCGAWVVAARGVSFTATFTPTSKSSPGTFGIEIDYTPESSQPSPLPNSSPTA